MYGSIFNRPSKTKKSLDSLHVCYLSPFSIILVHITSQVGKHIDSAAPKRSETLWFKAKRNDGIIGLLCIEAAVGKAWFLLIVIV